MKRIENYDLECAAGNPNELQTQIPEVKIGKSKREVNIAFTSLSPRLRRIIGLFITR
jgi:hypothetical protein